MTDEKKKAAQTFDKLLEQFPNDHHASEAAYMHATLSDQLDAPEAAESYRRVVERYRDSRFWSDAVMWLAQHELETNRFDKARATVRKLTESSPDKKTLSHALYLDARIAFAAGRLDEMEKSLNALVRKVPESNLRATADFWLAEIAYRKGQFDVARGRFKKLDSKVVSRTDSWVPLARLRRAQLLALDRDWDAALKIGKAILSKHPDFAQRQEVHYLMGRCLAARAKFSEARSAFLLAAPRDASTKNETAAMAQWMIGETYMHQENYEQAVTYFLKALELTPDSVMIQRNLALAVKKIRDARHRQ